MGPVWWRTSALATSVGLGEGNQRSTFEELADSWPCSQGQSQGNRGVPAKIVDFAVCSSHNASPWFLGHEVENKSLEKVKPAGMLLVMLAGWINWHQQDTIAKNPCITDSG